MDKKKRSKGITIVAWLFIIASVSAIIGALILKTRLSIYESKHFILPASYYYVVQICSIVNAVIYLVIGIGLLKILRWARSLAITWTIVNFIYAMGFFYMYTYQYTIPYYVSTDRPVHILYAGPLFSICWIVFVLFYFNRETIKVQFNSNI